MDSLTLKFAVGFLGKAKGVTGAPQRVCPLGRTSTLDLSGTGFQVYEVYQQSISASSTLSLDLTTGLTNPLGESINGTLDFATVKGILIEHDSTSTATSIRAFNGGTTEFQGPLSATSDVTLTPGQWCAFGMGSTVTGWTVSGSAKLLDILNNSGSAAAKVNIMIVGTV